MKCWRFLRTQTTLWRSLMMNKLLSSVSLETRMSIVLRCSNISSQVPTQHQLMLSNQITSIKISRLLLNILTLWASTWLLNKTVQRRLFTNSSSKYNSSNNTKLSNELVISTWTSSLTINHTSKPCNKTTSNIGGPRVCKPLITTLSISNTNRQHSNNNNIYRVATLSSITITISDHLGLRNRWKLKTLCNLTTI